MWSDTYISVIAHIDTKFSVLKCKQDKELFMFMIPRAKKLFHKAANG